MKHVVLEFIFILVCILSFSMLGAIWSIHGFGLFFLVILLYCAATVVIAVSVHKNIERTKQEEAARLAAKPKRGMYV